MTPEEAQEIAREIMQLVGHDPFTLEEAIAEAILSASRPYKIRPALADYGGELMMDRRAMRASHLANSILSLIGKHICRHEGKHHREAGQKLEQLFYQNGFDIVNDSDREAAGIPRRDERGWTAEELRILELYKNQIMLQPLLKDMTPLG